ncbi:Lreu_0056 family protein [Apilactobacillus timberlakei]|uniref:Lreu_0056 family protein n=1 Tax=Apilactobacillus timberlakei TaxID=2008380 RepID=UPI00112ECCA7|nr:hypothetical protein [Apilactobacillus timberlakei]TPR20544.1 hypothetical protein DY061_04320 [Apilactobacillus timberlakei]TPR22588.1 hypothetical protein DY083_03590 [Apilactobacillus timberlakei]
MLFLKKLTMTILVAMLFIPIMLFSVTNTSVNAKSKVSTYSRYKLNDKKLGIMMDFKYLYSPKMVKAGAVAYTNSKHTDMLKGYSYVTGQGDPTSYIYYKHNGNTAYYKYWYVGPKQDVAHGHYIKQRHVSIKYLVDKYYHSKAQRNTVNYYASKLRNEQ